MSAAQMTAEVPPEIIAYLDESHTLTLASASPSGTPHASTFLFVNDGATLYFWTRASTLTARHVAQNPVVSFAIDEYNENLDQTRGVQGRGECSVVLSGEQIAHVADLFGQRFPTLSPGSTMSISFFRIVPSELVTRTLTTRSSLWPGRRRAEAAMRPVVPLIRVTRRHSSAPRALPRWMVRVARVACLVDLPTVQRTLRLCLRVR